MRGCGDDVTLPKFKKQKTDETADQSTSNVATQSIPQNPKEVAPGAPSPANDKKRKAETGTPLTGNFGDTNKVERDCKSVFGLLLEELNGNASLSHPRQTLSS